MLELAYFLFGISVGYVVGILVVEKTMPRLPFWIRKRYGLRWK